MLSIDFAECPPNATIIPTLAATRPQQKINGGASLNTLTNNQNLLFRLANSQYQSYTTALTVTIAVGCFLLLLNILIFAGIYYQREKRATDAKKKEELTEAEQRCSPSSRGGCKGGGGGGGSGISTGSRKSSLQSSSGFTMVVGGGGGSGGGGGGGTSSFGEYSCYDEKIQCKEKHALADICSVELPMQEFKCGGNESNTNSLRRNGANDYINHTLNNLMLYPPTYSSAGHSTAGTSANGIVTYHQFHHQMPSSASMLTTAAPMAGAATVSVATEQCNQATQSEIPDVQDVGTGAMDNDVDLLMSEDGEVSPGIPEPPPPPRSLVPSAFQVGILRQQGGPQTPSATKKRVQIQEISV